MTTNCLIDQTLKAMKSKIGMNYEAVDCFIIYLTIFVKK